MLLCESQTWSAPLCPFVSPEDPVEELEVGDDGGQGPDVLVWGRAGHCDQGVESNRPVGVSVVLREAKPSSEVQPAQQSLLALLVLEAGGVVNSTKNLNSSECTQ